MKSSSAPEIASSAAMLLQAERTRTDRPPLTDDWPDLDLATAYAIQDAALEQRLGRGESVVGIKLGLTSPAKQRQMSVASPLTAWLTDVMILAERSQLPQDRLIHPRVEPEIVFRMGRRLEGPGVTADAALSAVDRVYAGLEIIDSRFTDFRFKLTDVVADNASSSLFVIGPKVADPAQLNLPLETCRLELDGRAVATATGADVMGNPAEALAVAANSLATRGRAIEAGWLVLTGGMTDAIPAPAGSVICAHFTHLGSVTVRG